MADEKEDKVLVYVREKPIEKDKIQIEIQLGLNPKIEEHKDLGVAVALS